MVVITRAMAPIGWITVRVPSVSATTFRESPSAQQQQPEDPTRIAQQPQEARAAQRQATGVRLDGTALPLRTEGQEEGARDGAGHRDPHHQAIPPGRAGPGGCPGR